MQWMEVMTELEKLGTERTKKVYLSNGAREPLFGVATGAMKPMAKQIKQNQALAEDLYATGNYDAMYFAGIIAEADRMTREDFERWVNQAYFYMLSDYVVAVTLTESLLNQTIANTWIQTPEELKQSAGWSTYCWSLGRWPDTSFQRDHLFDLLQLAGNQIHHAPVRVQYSLANFIHTVGLSYLPLHQEALSLAKEVGPISIERPGKKYQILDPYAWIIKDKHKNRIGFKRKYVRC